MARDGPGDAVDGGEPVSREVPPEGRGVSAWEESSQTQAAPCEDDRLPAIARTLRLAASRYGTPLYLTDVATIDACATELAEAFPDPWIRQYSLKANDLPAIVEHVTRSGIGANVVSRGEWALSRRAGVPTSRTTLEGIGKGERELADAVAAAREGDPLLWVSVESVEEAAALGELARRAGLGTTGAPRIDALVRLNPDVSPETHAGLAVGRGGSKFGLTERETIEAVEAGGGFDGPIRWRGLHLHVGSQLGAVDAWRDGVRRGLALVGLLKGASETFDTLDVGGGFPVGPIGTPVPRPARFARELPELLEAIPEERRPARLAVEPGRFLVARAGWLVARVLHVRDRDGRLVVIDAGMTELVRPALYGAYHQVVALTSLGKDIDAGRGDEARWDLARVDGPICESTDALGYHRLPPVRRGDVVAIRDAGAYGSSQRSAYNGRPSPPQVLLEADGRLVLARRRASLASLG